MGYELYVNFKKKKEKNQGTLLIPTVLQDSLDSGRTPEPNILN